MPNGHSPFPGGGPPQPPGQEKSDPGKTERALVLAKKMEADGSLKELLRIGTSILSYLTFCKVKPKGTPHAEVWMKAPKIFACYGIGIPESGSFRPNPMGEFRFFDPITGYVLSQSQMEEIMPKENRKKTEANFRKHCETPTGSFAYYIEVRDPNLYNGFVKLSDGLVYDAATYGLHGAAYNNPKEYAVTPKKLPGQVTVDPVTGEEIPNVPDTPALAGIGLAPLLLLGGLMFVGKGK